MTRETWSIEKLQEAALQFNNRTEFARGNPSAYSSAAKRKLLDQICGHMIAKQAPRYSDDVIRSTALQFNHAVDFRRAHASMYQAAHTRGILASVTMHMTPKHREIDYAAHFAEKYADKFTLLSEYKSSKERVTVRCNECGEQWDTIPFRIRCKKCGMENRRTRLLTHEIYEASLPDNIEVIERYVHATHKIKHKCKDCEHEWLVKPNGIRSGTGCPVCNYGHVRASKGEQEIADRIEALGITITRNTRSIIKPQELDVFIPSHNLAIEFNGAYWHSRQPANYHLDKTKACEAIGARLIHIWEHEQNNQIMWSIIKAALGRFERTVHARKCVVSMIDWRDTAIFLQQNHIQGAGSPTTHNVALLHDGEIVAVMTFGKPRFEQARDWELIRYAVARDTRIVGGAQRLWSRRPAGSVVTYSDRRLFDGALYARLGFSRDHESAPGYFYVGRDGATVSRYQAQRKNLPKLLGDGFDPSLSEAENMTIAGYRKIFDCGTVRWVFSA